MMMIRKNMLTNKKQDVNIDGKNGDSLGGGNEQLKEEDINEIDEKDQGIS